MDEKHLVKQTKQNSYQTLYHRRLCIMVDWQKCRVDMRLPRTPLPEQASVSHDDKTCDEPGISSYTALLYSIARVYTWVTLFLAHLSRRLIGELIGYPWSGVRPSVVRPFTMLKDLLRNRLADESQILCGASLVRGNDILLAASGSHDQDGRHAHIW